jgi:hypothetical protein
LAGSAIIKGDIMKKEIQNLKKLNSELSQVCRNKTIKIIELEKKIKYLEELDRKNFLNILKLENKIQNYEANFIECYKVDALQNDYINALQIIENLKKKRG